MSELHKQKEQKGKIEEPKRSDRELLKFLWSFVVPYKKTFILVGVFLLINVIFGITAPLLFRTVLDFVDTTPELSPPISLVIQLLSAYFIINIAKWFASIAQNIYTVRLNARIIQDIRVNSFESILNNQLSFFDHQETGVLTSQIMNDVQELSDTGERFVHVVTSFIRLAGILGILFYFSPVMTGVSLAFLPVFFLIVFSLRKFQRKVAKAWRANFANVNQRFNELMRSISISKAFAREKENTKQFTDLNEKTYQSAIKRAFAIFIISPINDFNRHLLLIVILALGAVEHANGLDIATVYLFVFLLDYYYYPALQLARNYSRFQSSFAILERLLKISENPIIKEQNLGKTDASALQGQIEFQHVDFSYTPEKQILKDISFLIQPGQRVALVGETGAGKTTIAALLSRFYKINSGDILLDGISINEYDLASLRHAIGMVSQRVLLFTGTIRENLLIGNAQATDEQLWAALDVVQAREFIELLPNGLDFHVTEGGKNLSAGQRQMVSFARVILADPRIIILDEATSAVDLYTESKIQDAMDILLENRTSVVIAHRLTTILKSDKIIVLNDGKCVQIGTHTDLINQSGLYRDMYNLYFQTQSAQYLEQIITKS
ncbi:MAG: ABC transporter ATP-binding protein [Promethearchaeota archaeon]